MSLLDSVDTSIPRAGTGWAESMNGISHYESDILGFIGTAPTPNPCHTVLHRGAPAHFFFTSRYVAHLLVPHKDMQRQAKLNRSSAQEQLPLTKLPRAFTILGGTAFNAAPDGRVVLALLMSTPELPPDSESTSTEGKDLFYRMMVYGQYTPAQSDIINLCGDVQVFYLSYIPTFITHTQLLTPTVARQTGTPSASPSVLVQSLQLSGLIASAPLVYTDIIVGGGDRCVHTYRTTGVLPVGLNVNETPAAATSLQSLDCEKADFSPFLSSYILTVNQTPNAPKGCSVSPPVLSLSPRKIWLPDYVQLRHLVANTPEITPQVRQNLKRLYDLQFGMLHFLPSLFYLDLVRFITPTMPSVCHIPAVLQGLVKKRGKTSTDHYQWRTPLLVHRGKVINKHILDVLSQFPKTDALKHVQQQSSKAPWLPCSQYNEISPEMAGTGAFQHQPTSPLCFNATINDSTCDRVLAVGCQNGLVRMQVTFKAYPSNMLEKPCHCQMPVKLEPSLFTAENINKHTEQCQCTRNVWAYAPLRFTFNALQKIHSVLAGDHTLVASRYTSRLLVLHRLWLQDILRDSNQEAKQTDLSRPSSTTTTTTTNTTTTTPTTTNTTNTTTTATPTAKRKSIVTQRILPGPVTCLRAFAAHSRGPYQVLSQSKLLDPKAPISSFTATSTKLFALPPVRTFLVHPDTLFPSLCPDSSINPADIPDSILNSEIDYKTFSKLEATTSIDSTTAASDYHQVAGTATGHTALFHNVNCNLQEQSSLVACTDKNATVFSIEVADLNLDGMNELQQCCGDKLVYAGLHRESAPPLLPRLLWDTQKPSQQPEITSPNNSKIEDLSFDPLLLANRTNACLQAFSYKQYATHELSQLCSSVALLPKPVFYSSPSYSLMEVLLAQQAQRTKPPYALPHNTGILALKKKLQVEDGMLITCGSQGISFHARAQAYLTHRLHEKETKLQRIQKMQKLLQEYEQNKQSEQ